MDATIDITIEYWAIGLTIDIRTVRLLKPQGHEHISVSQKQTRLPLIGSNIYWMNRHNH